MTEGDTSARRDFRSLYDCSSEQLGAVLNRAIELKDRRRRGKCDQTLAGKTLAMIFEKSSTRTRVSFEVGMFELGGHAIYLSSQGSQIGRGEPIADTARVLSGYCSGIVIRTFSQQRVEQLAQWSTIPVINGLSDTFHPCQVVADLQTVQEVHGTTTGLRYAWIGDGNNMAHSWINAAGVLGLELVLACPSGYQPDPAIVQSARERIARLGSGSIAVVTDPKEAARGSHILSTDVWSSMGQEEETAKRRTAFAGYCIDATLLALAAPNAKVLHCLPAHRGEEISAEVLEGPQCVVWQQAENRLHVQKAILELLLGAN